MCWLRPLHRSLPYGCCPALGDESNDILNRKIAEYSKAVVTGRPHFHISLCSGCFNCDCHSENDIPIVPDVGMFASFDPVALDVACADAVNKQPVISGSQLESYASMYTMTTSLIPLRRPTGTPALNMR